MQVSHWVILGTVQAYVLLLGITIFLLLKTRGLKGLILSLHARLKDLISDLKNAKAENQQLKDAASQSGDFGEQLEEMLTETREHHQAQSPDRDIILDLASDTPMNRQTCALRYANLLAEKEAFLGGKNRLNKWKILHHKYEQMLALIRDNASNSADESDNNDLKQKIANLEKFKKLFFEAEDRWKEAAKQAEIYYEQLSNLDFDSAEGDTFNQLIEQYHQNFQGLGDSFNQHTHSTKTSTLTVETIKSDPKTISELHRLRSVAKDQHQLINQLQMRLQQASSEEEKQQLIIELQQQLERQLRFVQESETCIQLLEKELAQAHQDNAQLQQEVQQTSRKSQTIASFKQAVNDLEDENRILKKRVQQLDQENHQLVDQLSILKDFPAEDSSALEEELDKLRREYTELENRYLDLRMQNN